MHTALSCVLAFLGAALQPCLLGWNAISRAQLWSRIGLAGSLGMLFGTVSPAVYSKLVVSHVRV